MMCVRHHRDLFYYDKGDTGVPTDDKYGLLISDVTIVFIQLCVHLQGVFSF